MPKRGYLSKNAYYWQKQYLIARDGEKCAICGRTSGTTKLDVEHLDTNTFNRDPSNLRLLCRICNLAVRKMPMASKAKLCLKDSRHIVCERGVDGKSVRTNENYGDSVDALRRDIADGNTKADATVTLSILMREALKEWLYTWLKEYGFITLSDAKIAGANEMGGSSVCAERWIKQWATPINGWIDIVQDNGSKIVLLRDKQPEQIITPETKLRKRNKKGQFISEKYN